MIAIAPVVLSLAPLATELSTVGSIVDVAMAPCRLIKPPPGASAVARAPLPAIGAMPSWLLSAETVIVPPASTVALPRIDAVTVGLNVPIATEAPTAKTPTFTPMADTVKSATDDALTVTVPVTVTFEFEPSEAVTLGVNLAIEMVALPATMPPVTPIASAVTVPLALALTLSEPTVPPWPISTLPVSAVAEPPTST